MPTDELAVGVINVRGVAATILAFAASVFLLHEAAPLFVTVFLSLLLAYALEPFVSALMPLHVPRLGAVVLVYLILATALGLCARVARNQLVSFLDDVPATIASLRQTMTRQAASGDQPDAFDRLHGAARELHEALAPRTPNPPADVARVLPVRRSFDARAYLARAGWGVAYVGARAFVVAFLTFVLLATGDLYKRKLMKLVGPRWEKGQVTLDVIRTIDRHIERYLVARVLISVIVSVATGAGLWMLGMPHAIVWGAIAGLLNVLPIVGPSVAIVLITLAAFLHFRTLEMTAAAGGIATVVAALEGNLVTPWLMSKAGELNTVAVFIAVLFWGWVWGMWGLLLAVPMMVAIKAVADHIEPIQPLGELLSR